MNPSKRMAIFTRFREANPEPRTELEYRTPFELLIAVILSAQATDKSVNIATRELYLVRGHETRIALRSRNLLGSRGPDPGFSGFEYPLAPRELFLEIAHMY